MSVARGRKYLEETKQRQQEGQKARTEARIVKLKLTDLKARISDLLSVRRPVSKLHTEVVPAQHNTRHKANVRQIDENMRSEMKERKS